LKNFNFLQFKQIKIFVHFIWYQGWEFAPQRVVLRLESNKEKWAKAGFEIKKWDQRSIEELIRRTHPEELAWFVSLQTVIAKCDVARAFVLEAEGGLYADCDFDPGPKINEFWQRSVDLNKVVFPAQRPFGLNNYLIAAQPRSAFWMGEYVPAVKAAFTSPRLLDLVVGVRNHTWPVLTTTGPILISRLVSKSKRSTSVRETEPREWGKHGWFDGDKNSAWYVNSTSKLQQYVVDSVLALAILGLGLILYWIFYFIKT